MKRKMLHALMLALIFALATASISAAAPKSFSTGSFKNEVPCGLWWFDKAWNTVWIEGIGHTLPLNGGRYIMTCRFKVDFTNPELLSREEFCADPGFAFMCKGKGALVDNQTTCNLDANVRRGIVVASPNVQGFWTCQVK